MGCTVVEVFFYCCVFFLGAWPRGNMEHPVSGLSVWMKDVI